MPRLHEILVSPLIGGAGIVAIRLAAAARERGVPCLAWVPGHGPASEALSREQVDWRTYNLDAMSRSSVAHLLVCASIVPTLFSLERSVVHVHNPVVYRYLR